MDKIQQYLDELKNSDPEIRKGATSALWEYWYQEGGEEAEQKLLQGTELLNENHLDQAEEIFSDIVQHFPDFAEGHNKLATVLYLRGRYRESIDECRTALKMNPNHFGAWNGMGMCLYKIAQYDEAIKSFEVAIQIQPYADINRGYIARCRGKLN